MEPKKDAACKVQTASPSSCLAFFKVSFTKGTVYYINALLFLLGGLGWGSFCYLTHPNVEAEGIGVDQDFFDFAKLEGDVTPCYLCNVLCLPLYGASEAQMRTEMGFFESSSQKGKTSQR